MPNFKFYGKFFAFTFYLLTFIGCATVAPVATIPKPQGIPGFYHAVKKGETLWKISQNYDVELDELININLISDANRIEIEQLIFIPGPEKPKNLSKEFYTEDFIWPAKGEVIATFGQTTSNMVNKGINIETRKDSNVIAARSGKVVFYASDFYGFGKMIIIDHGDGLSTVYARNSEVFVKTGDEVTRGALIGKVGSAGRDKNVYLHFEIRKGIIPKNPYFYLP
jgi:murein DD-endopeptidase MepM/ murein hydrolase activator NlpD